METANNNAANRTLQVTKLLNAPAELVWEVWTNPGHIGHWWGPAGFTNTIEIMEVKAGGNWRLIMHGPDGKRYPNKSVFLEIVPFKKIVFQHFNPNYIATITFDLIERKTLMNWNMTFETAELFETVVKIFKANEGLAENAEKLEHYLNEIMQH